MNLESRNQLSPTLNNLFELDDLDVSEKLSEKRRLKSNNKRLSDEILRKYEINVHKFSNIHYRFEGYDYWPTTTKWMKYRKIKGRTVYSKKDSGFGLESLLELLEFPNPENN